MKPSKKAQGISINTIIVAAIALIVLVILIAIFTGRMGIFNKELSDQEQGTADCETTLDGEWMLASDCNDAGRQAAVVPLKDSEEMSAGGTKVCCLRQAQDKKE